MLFLMFNLCNQTLPAYVAIYGSRHELESLHCNLTCWYTDSLSTDARYANLMTTCIIMCLLLLLL